MSYGRNFPVSFDFPIAVGEGYFVFVNQKTTFTLTGDLVSLSSIPVVKGWNLIGFDRLEGSHASKLLVSGVGCKVKAVSLLDASSGEYKSFAAGFPSSYDFNVTCGRAYYVFVDTDGTLKL